MRILGMALFALVWWASQSEAACSGSGLTWTCTAGSTIEDVNSALGSASDGATITFQSGSYTWSTGTINNFSNTKGVTLICAKAGTCNVNATTGQILNLTYSGTNTKLYRFSGFNFTNASCGSGFCFHIHHANSGGTGVLQNLRIDHNAFAGVPLGTHIIQIGATDRGGEVYGVLDHNTVTQNNAVMFIHVLGNAYQDTTPWGPTSRGTADVLYVEDNTWTFNDANAPLDACTDAWLGGKLVVRYNTALNCRLQTHGAAHGGVELWEVYRNDVRTTFATGNDATTCYACIQSQGAGEMFVFDNTLRGVSSVGADAITTQDYRSGSAQPGSFGLCDGTKSVDGNFTPVETYRGYPCKLQPGFMETGGTPTYGKSSPVAVFRNVSGHSGAKIDLSIRSNGSPEYWDEHLVENRDYYNAVSVNAQTSPTSPFNGTIGIGHGTLANRPTTCTNLTLQNGDTGSGVMYWATDQGSWNQSGDGRGSGVLYRCSATNTWTVHYTPYTYPHPLQTDSGGGAGDVTPPTAPTNLRIQ